MGGVVTTGGVMSGVVLNCAGAVMGGEAVAVVGVTTPVDGASCAEEITGAPGVVRGLLSVGAPTDAELGCDNTGGVVTTGGVTTGKPLTCNGVARMEVVVILV